MTIITALNNNEEEVVLQRMKKNARDNCKPALEALVECTKTKTFSMFWKCTMERDEVYACVSQYTTDQIHQDMRRAEISKKIEYLKKHGKYPPEE